jgi:Tfp pilus assembly protein PilV
MNRERGTTLIEVIIAITVIAIAVTSMLGLLSAISVRSAGAMTASQAASIASAYLDEALSQPYTHTIGPANRANFDDILDYNFSDNGVRDANDAPIAGLGLYTVQVTAVPATLGAVANAVRVDVVVTAPDGRVTLLSGFRTSYNGRVLRP